MPSITAAGGRSTTPGVTFSTVVMSVPLAPTQEPGPPTTNKCREGMKTRQMSKHRSAWFQGSSLSHAERRQIVGADRSTGSRIGRVLNDAESSSTLSVKRVVERQVDRRSIRRSEQVGCQKTHDLHGRAQLVL